MKIGSIALAGLLTALGVGLAGQYAVSLEQTALANLSHDQAHPALVLGSTRESFARVRSRIAQAGSYDTQKDIDTALKNLGTYERATLDGVEELAASDLTGPQREVVEQRLRPAVREALTEIDTTLVPLADHPMTDAERRAFTQAFTTTVRAPIDRAQKALDEIVRLSEERLETSVAEAAAQSHRIVLVLWGVAGLGALVVGLLGAWVTRLVTAPLAAVRHSLEAVAGGDLTVDAGTVGRDETGDMALSLRTARESLRATVATIAASSTTVAHNAEGLFATSADVARNAEHTTRESGEAAAAAAEVSHHVQTVAAATEEMAASIGEISASSADAVRVAAAAVEQAQAANTTVGQLGQASAEIDAVVKAITSIAEQTNLLALNATIEAARAGEAGKGFAVVASEVKELAQETARATQDITGRIAAIQVGTAAAVESIARIGQIIEDINGYQTTIASAVEEQAATTAEMSHSVHEAAAGSATIARTIENVAQAARSTGTGIVETQRAAEELVGLSGALGDVVAHFRV